MRRGAYLIILAWLLTVPLSLAHAEQTLQQRYLDIYLEINDAEHLVKQGDYRGALDDFRDCYAKLSKIHESDPDWETALVVHRMADCKAKVLELEPLVAAQPPPAPPTPVTPAPPAPGPDAITPSPTPNYNTPSPTATSVGGDADEVNSLKQELQAVKDELRLIKAKYADSQAQLETYRIQLQTVNAQLAAASNQGSVDDRMGKLLSDNKALTDKLAAAQREIDDLKSNPKSKLALAQAQLKNLQDQYAASQEANKALQDTTTTLKTQLDQAQSDLGAANQKLADLGPGSPEYQTLKRENEIMRDILTRELQEQAHRDMAKRLAQEEFDNLKLKSEVLQENLDILGSHMTAPTNDQERALLASLKVPGPDVTQPSSENNFSAPAGGSPIASATDPAPANSASAPAGTTPSSSGTNMASGTPPATNPVADTPSATTNLESAMPPTVGADNATTQPPVNIVMNDPPSSGADPAPPAATPSTSTPDPSSTAPSSVTPTPTPAPTSAPNPDPTTSTAPSATSGNVPDPKAPIPPVTPPGQTASTPAVTNAGAVPETSDPNAPTTSHIPPGTETVTTTTTETGGSAPSNQDDPSKYASQPRLPDDMRETAQDAADLFKNQKYDESAAKYQSIIEKYPESLYAWSNLGVVRFQQGKYDDALKALQQAVKLSPTDAFSYSNLGIVYYQLNQYENAIDALNSAKALDPNDAKTHNYLGCAESQKGWQEVAEREFRKAIEIDPNFGDAHFNLALVYATSKPPSLELARREYKRALELGIAKDQRLEKLLGEPQP